MQQVCAQPADPGGGAAARRRISAVCQPETARFCPALSATVPRPRDQYICLKPYKASLSFNCRSAVAAFGAK